MDLAVFLSLATGRYAVLRGYVMSHMGYDKLRQRLIRCSTGSTTRSTLQCSAPTAGSTCDRYSLSHPGDDQPAPDKTRIASSSLRATKSTGEAEHPAQHQVAPTTMRTKPSNDSRNAGRDSAMSPSMTFNS